MSAASRAASDDEATPGSLADLLASARERARALQRTGPTSTLAHADELRLAYRDIAGSLERALALLGPDTVPAAHTGAGVAAGDIVDLHRALTEVTEDHIIARLGRWEQVQAGVQRLMDLGPVSEIIDRGPTEAAGAVDLERVVLSRIEDGRLIAEAVHVDDDPEAAAAILAALRAEPATLEYPLIEVDMLRRRRPLLVEDPDSDPRGRPATGLVMGWRDYVTAPIVLESRVVGFFHGDRRLSERPVTALDRDALRLFADGFAQTFERAVLRRRLRTQRQEMRRVASWADARTSELNDRAISLLADREPAEADQQPSAPSSGPEIRELLTRREIDVLELMVTGETNATIAKRLVVSEGTIKFHVKNILRKMQAANRAEATSRYLRMKLHRPSLRGDGDAG